VILLRYYRGLSLAEIAQSTGTPFETVRTRLKRGHELLRSKLDRDCGGRACWSLALARLGELQEPGSLAIGSSSLATIGGVIMSWKYLAAAAVLVVALGTIWTTRESTALTGAAHNEAPLEADATFMKWSMGPSSTNSSK